MKQFNEVGSFEKKKKKVIILLPRSFDAQSAENFEDVVGSNGCPINAVSCHYFTHVVSFHDQVVLFGYFSLINVDDRSVH